MHWHFVVDPVPTKNKLPRDLLPAVWHFRKKLIIVVCVHACMSEWVSEWVSEWLSEWLSELLNEQARLVCLLTLCAHTCVHACVCARGVWWWWWWVGPSKKTKTLQQLGQSWNSVKKAWCHSNLFADCFSAILGVLKLFKELEIEMYTSITIG